MERMASTGATLRAFSFPLVAFLSLVIGTVVLGEGADDSPQRCLNLLPGLDKMSLGIDVTSFDKFSKDSQGLKHQVVPYTCDQQKKNGEYDIPDQISALTAIPAGELSSTVKVVNSYKKTRRAITANLQMDLVYRAFGFSSSSSLNVMQNSVFNKSTWIMKVSMHVSVRRVQMYHDVRARLHHNPVEEYLNSNLPTDVDLTGPVAENVFMSLIREFGTHFFSIANYAGLVDFDMETTSEYYLRHDEIKLENQARLTFLNILGLSISELSFKGEEVDESFREATTISKKYFGGSTNLLEDGSFRAWQPTVPDLPYLSSGKLLPISTLISNETLRVAVEGAINDYVLRSYLEELSRLLWSRHVWQNAGQKLQALQDRIKRFREMSSPLTKDMTTSLANDVLREVTVPDWFTDKQRKCYEWFPGSEGQCKGPTTHMCVSPSLMTKESAREHSTVVCPTVSEAGTKQDPWFANKELCFRWKECKAGWKNEFCASINDLTTTDHYAVDDGIGKTCKVEWKIKVPENATTWMQNLQLCFLWVSDQAGGTCQGRSCVLSDVWTPYRPEKANLLHKCTSGGVSPALDHALKPVPVVLLVLFCRMWRGDVW